MSNKHNKTAKPAHHDDCDDCKRERRQNDSLIAIYQKLQSVDKSTQRFRKSLQKHKQQLTCTSSKFNDFVCKLNSVPKESKADIQLKSLGYDMANSMLYQMNTGPVAKQQLGLRNRLSEVYRVRESIKKRSQSTNTQRVREQPIDIIKNNTKQLNNLELSYSFLKNQQIVGEDKIYIDSKTSNSPQDTRTTAFYSHENRSPGIGGLNLWLYEQKQSKGFEKELFDIRIQPRKRAVKKAAPSVLPALRSTRYEL